MTPYDTALRVQRREVDAVRVSISAEVDRIAEIEMRSRAHDASMIAERSLAQALPIASDAWAARMRMERLQMDHAANLAEARLRRLRDQAVEAFGTMRAIEVAAERYQDEEDRIVAGAEQSAADDLAAARFLRTRRMQERRA